jgi:glycerol uptake facilitator-like aquaporin
MLIEIPWAEIPWAFVFQLVGAIGSVATAVAVIFLGIQSRQTRKQIELTRERS